MISISSKNATNTVAQFLIQLSNYDFFLIIVIIVLLNSMVNFLKIVFKRLFVHDFVDIVIDMKSS